MLRSSHKITLGLAGFTMLAGFAAVNAPAPAEAQVGRQVSFTKDVLPIFQRRCQLCHGVEARGGLKLDSYENLMAGGAKGPAVVKGSPANSLLVQYIEGARQPRMPVGGAPLTRPEISSIRAWVQQGARDDTSGPLVAAKANKPLEITEPKDGATVREKVRVVIPREGIPPEGFLAVYVDKKFKVALAPPSEEELEDKKLPPNSPVTYIWDTKAPLVDDRTAVAEDRFLKEGPHVIEIISYDSLGQEAERAAAQVELRNQIEFVTNLPVPLMYAGKESMQYELQHEVDLDATAAAGGADGPAKISHKETTNYLVSLEDMLRTTGTGFWRQRRESPINVTVNDLKQIVRIDTQSRYYSMDRQGNVRRSRQMEREKQEPILNPIDLPGRPHRMNETFPTDLRVNLGAYIPSVINVNRLEATTEGIEWQYGEKCVRIKLNYLAGTATLDLNSMNMPGCEFEIENGNSTIWFSTDTQRVLKAEHEITGNMNVPVQSAGGGMSAMGGEGVPGMGMGPGMGMMAGGMGMMPGGPGMMMGGAPGMGMTPSGPRPGGMGGPGLSTRPPGYPGAGGPMGPGGTFGAPFAGPGGMPRPGMGGTGYPGIGGSRGPGMPGAPMGGTGYPGVGGSGYPGMGGAGYPGMGGAGYPGMGGAGYPGMGGAGYPGMGGAGYPGMGGAGGGLDLGIAPATKRYHTNIKVRTTLVYDDPKAKAPAAPKATPTAAPPGGESNQ